MKETKEFKLSKEVSVYYTYEFNKAEPEVGYLEDWIDIEIESVVLFNDTFFGLDITGSINTLELEGIKTNILDSLCIL